MKYTQEEVVLRAQEGDKESFSLIVEKYSSIVYNLAIYLMNNKEDAEEVTQEVFLRVYKGLPKFRRDCSFYTWLYRITVNLCHTKNKRKAWNKFILFSQMPSAEQLFSQPETSIYSQPEKLILEKEKYIQLERALKALPLNYRTPLILKEIEELPYEEIAQILNCSLGTVKSRIFRAREQLRKIFTSLSNKKEREDEM